MNVLENIMGVNEAAEKWGLSPGTIKNYCSQKGKVLAVKIEGKWILDKNQENPSQPEHPKNWRGRQRSTKKNPSREEMKEKYLKQKGEASKNDK